MDILDSMMLFLDALSHNRFVDLVIIAVILDTVFGLLRAIKERKFNSCFGIDGAIRKIAMVISIVILAIVDKLMGFNMLPFVPEEILGHIGIAKMGICEFFCLLYIMYEAVSILKNMCLCGLPIPLKLRTVIEKWLNTMTSELEGKETSLKIGSDDNENRN